MKTKQLTQPEISIAAMIGRLEGSADSLDNLNSNYFDPNQGLVITLVSRASINLRGAARELRQVMSGKVPVKELAEYICPSCGLRVEQHRCSQSEGF